MKTLLTTLLLTIFTLLASAQQKPSFIPQPENIAWMEGSFVINKKTSISTASATLRPAAEYLASILSKSTAVEPKLKKHGGTIRLSLSENIAESGYMLTVTPKLITIVAGDYQGVVNGISTLRQMLPEKAVQQEKVASSASLLPCCKILDAPRFEWRGMHLDPSRHFFTKEETKELLDVLALYKINKLHWHLTDDQGWRIEIKKYPLLTERGAWRIPNNQDTICVNRAHATDDPDMLLPGQTSDIKGTGERWRGAEYGGFYTQDDIREIVAYARQRGIDIVPEIDIPGHSLCAIANYEGLACTEKTGWGKFFTTPLCPGKDRALEFCKDVYREIFDLFPYHYVHIGGDEVDWSHWKRCPDCQKRMRENRLKTEAELQSWFLHQMEQFFNENGRDMVGWDEIIAGGLSATSTVMWWRAWNKDAIQDAVRHGNRVVCSPTSYFYLDTTPATIDLSGIYNFNAQPDDITPEQQKLVIGVQGNLWTEWVPTRERMYYQAFPRMLAVAELGWSKLQNKDFDDFQRRLLPHYDRLQQLGVIYRRPDLKGFSSSNVFTDEALVDVTCHDPSAIIRYTTDGSIPQATSKRYEGPFTISENTDFAFRIFAPDGHKGQTVLCTYRKEDFAPAYPLDSLRTLPEKKAEVFDVGGENTAGMSAATSSDTSSESPLKSGLCCEWYDYEGPRCADIDQAPLLATLVAPEVCIPDSCRDNIGLILSGFIEVPADGIYTFALNSDDGSYLMLDGKMVVDNDGEHSPNLLVGQHAMRRGLHPLLVRYFDHNGGLLELTVTDQQGNPVRVGYFH
ncbi:MAG: family 20 glycosylhydrolase [Prevotella sp.]|nr:family 20 glycosylhydrolase [Prevotella sp.]